MTWEPQRLGPNWRGQQFQHWRIRGIDALGPSATEILLFVMDGCDSIIKLRDKTGLSASCIQGHVRRLRGLGLVRWTCKRGEPIIALCVHAVNVYDVLTDEPNDSCDVESTSLD